MPEGFVGAPGELVFYRDASGETLTRLLVDVAVDEEFMEQVGDRWEQHVYEMVASANNLFAGVGLDIEIASVTRWLSDDAVESLATLLGSSEEQVQRGPGRLLLVITCQDTIKYDGWAQNSKNGVIMRFYHDGQEKNAGLIAHEIGHLLGGRHHEDEEDCIEDGCIMDQRGYAHATTWCPHHQEVIEDEIASRLAI